VAATPQLRVFPSPAELFRGAAEEFSALAAQAVREHGRFSVALSGGSTPKGLYSLLADRFQDLPWNKIYFFWGDERHVPPESPESNYRMVREALLSRVALPEDHVFRVRGEETDADAAAREYERALAGFFGLQPGQFPRFDLILLGLGEDGHTASLFPGSRGLQEKGRLVIANWVEKFKDYRISFTYPVLEHAACVMFVVSGAAKAPILRQVLEEPLAGLPSQAVQVRQGSLLWFVDAAAASALQKPNVA